MTRLQIAAVISFVLVGLSGLAEILFYGDIGPHGAVNESLFLPLTFVFLVAGVVFLILSHFVNRR
ncbi:hypothetical protein [Cognatishimia sp. MH4019]|uniref:hypothetical protein n=1 Tax=Cognatishimia sp. MH4019 TaxID=2854030 RepID=UPI001CD7723A|nr:hypothetical protein [Cognatishimia sp. MH4019]